MATTEPLIGKSVTLKSVDIDDAQFIIDLRNDASFSKYLPKLEVTLEQQKKWIEQQRLAEDDYYFLIWDNEGKRLGTLSIYNIVDGHGENGRLACLGNAFQVMESEYLVNEFTFNVIKLDYFDSNIVQDNSAPQRIVKYFGGKFDSKPFDFKGMPTLHARTYKEDYFKCKSKFEKMLKH